MEFHRTQTRKKDSLRDNEGTKKHGTCVNEATYPKDYPMMREQKAEDKCK